MATPLRPQEIFLLERYGSVPYFEAMRDDFACLLDVAEQALAEFMKAIPPDYRSRPEYQQPDAVWGERILPILRWTLEGLDVGLLQLKQGDANGLFVAGNVETAFSSINRDYSCDWMSPPLLDLYDRHQRACSHRVSNIVTTARGDWDCSDLTEVPLYSGRGPLDPPATWPLYACDLSVRVQTDDPVPETGIYLPDADLSAAQLLIKGRQAWEANVPPPDGSRARFVRLSTIWTLVRRQADQGGGIPGQADEQSAGVRLRALAGERCPRSGYWSTPVRLHSRRDFTAGDTMPSVEGDYGVTIWQWDGYQ